MMILTFLEPVFKLQNLEWYDATKYFSGHSPSI